MSILSRIFSRQIEFYEFTYKNNKYYYTSSDREAIFMGKVFKPFTMKRSALSSTSQESKKSITIVTTKDFPIAQLFKKFTPQQIELKLFRASRDDLQDYDQIFEGIVNSCNFKSFIADLEIKPFSAHSSRQVCRYAFSTMCNHHVYNGKCNLDIELFSENVGVVNVESDGVTILLDSVKTSEEQYYRNGVITTPNGDSRQIIDQQGTLIKIMSPFEEIAVEDVVKISAGCDRTSATCKSRFNNFENFLGFENVPERNVYTDGV